MTEKEQQWINNWCTSVVGGWSAVQYSDSWRKDTVWSRSLLVNSRTRETGPETCLGAWFSRDWPWTSPPWPSAACFGSVWCQSVWAGPEPPEEEGLHPHLHSLVQIQLQVVLTLPGGLSWAAGGAAPQPDLPLPVSQEVRDLAPAFGWCSGLTWGLQEWERGDKNSAWGW